MKLVQFLLLDRKIRIGILEGNNVIDVNSSYNFIPNSLVQFLHESHAMNTLEQIRQNPRDVYPLHMVRLISPITKPDKIFCIGFNYKDFCDVLKEEYPKEPITFSKFSSAIVGPYDLIELPGISDQVDWEVELAVVIGKKAKNVEVADAYDYILGYTVAQDISARDWQEKNGGQFLLSKTMDTFCPLGPYLVTKDEIKDVNNLSLKTWVNGELKQDGSTKNYIHKIDKLIEHLSSVMTLHPGDIILTGTPPGCGYWAKPPQFLKDGDILESEISEIGKLINKVVA